MLGALLTAPAERRAALLDQLSTPLLDEADSKETVGTPDPDEDTDGAAQTEEAPEKHSARSIPLSMRIRAARIARGWE